MRTLTGLLCGYIFGLGLLISGMIQPAKVLGFLDVFGIPAGDWDPSLAVVMAAALAVTGAGYALLRPRAPLFNAKFQWPTQIAVDRPLVAGAILFGIGWGLVGLCPGPAIENLATLSPGVIVFVISMAIGMAAHSFWQARRVAAPHGDLTGAKTADG
ncbi:MAG: DUF6691 family protein [Xanthobacteraceae bacterium]